MASKPISTLLLALARPSRSIVRGPQSLLPSRLARPTRSHFQKPSLYAALSARHAHTIPRPPSTGMTPETTPASEEPSEASGSRQPRRHKLISRQPSYELTFTCVPCGTRSAHKISKQGYHHGSVLITCPSCRNRHIISDHLNIFGNRQITVEDLMREKGRLVKKGTLGEDGDIEFWEDGTTTVREERQATDPVPRENQTVDDGAAPGASWGGPKNKSG